MTPELAKQILEEQQKSFSMFNQSELSTAIGVALDSLERDIARPIKRGNSFQVNGYCPNCDALVSVIMHQNFCKNCGQKLDWDG